MPDLVVVVGPNGEETHTVMNARDFVLHVPGYSYGNGKKASPVDSSPYAVSAPPPGTPEPAKAVLDRYGSGSSALDVPMPAAPVIFKAPQVAEAAPAPVVEGPAEVASDEREALIEDEKLAGMIPADATEPMAEPDEAVAPAKPERQRRAPKSEA